MLRNRWHEAREKAAIKARADGDAALAVLIRQFQFIDIRPKAASEIELTHASRLLGHSTEEMTKKFYRRVGEIVNPTKCPAGVLAPPSQTSTTRYRIAILDNFT